MNDKLKRSDLMRLAVLESQKCMVWPRVGVTIAKNGIVLSTGYKGERDGVHAERCAIEKLSSEDLIGSVLFTTLEPCVGIDGNQKVESCTELILSTQIDEVVIGILDENGSVYGKGYNALVTAGKQVASFNEKLRDELSSSAYKCGDPDAGSGTSGTRRVSIIGSAEKKFSVKPSETDSETISFRWCSLQPSHGCVDLIAGTDEIREAVHMERFEDVHDPLLYNKLSYVSRMRENKIAIVFPKGSKYVLLIQLINIFENDISFRWQARKLK